MIIVFSPREFVRAESIPLTRKESLYETRPNRRDGCSRFTAIHAGESSTKGEDRDGTHKIKKSTRNYCGIPANLASAVSFSREDTAKKPHRRDGHHRCAPRCASRNIFGALIYEGLNLHGCSRGIKALTRQIKSYPRADDRYRSRNFRVCDDRGTDDRNREILQRKDGKKSSFPTPMYRFSSFDDA